MKRIISNQSIRNDCGIKTWFILLILIATTVQPKASLGQAEKDFANLLISDAAIPELLALANTDGVKKDSMKLLFQLKGESLKNRLNQVVASREMMWRRIEVAKVELERWRAMVDEKAKVVQTKSTGFPTSRVAAEQLLLAAQLELQKVTWDLASELALSESETITKDAPESKIQVLQRKWADLESKIIVESLQSAENDLQRVEQLAKQGTISSSEVANARQSALKARSALEMHQLRTQLAEAQQLASKNAQNAEVMIQIRKLTARKKQIENYIHEMFSAMRDLTEHEMLLTRANREEETIATLSKLEQELQTKMDEISGLSKAVKSVEFIEKKE